MRASLFVLLAFAATVSAAPVPKEVKKKRPDAEVFVGVWEIVTSEQDGQPKAKATWTFEEDLTMWSKPPGATDKGTKWAIKIDPEKTPREINISSYAGIYEFDGDDIRVLFAYSSTRPTSFDEKQKAHYVLLRRMKGDGK